MRTALDWSIIFERWQIIENPFSIKNIRFQSAFMDQRYTVNITIQWNNNAEQNKIKAYKINAYKS